MPPDSEPRVLMGVVTKAHGIKGQVIVKWFGEDPEAASRYGTFEDESGRQTYRIASAKPHKADTLLVRFAEIDTRDAADALRGTQLFVRRSILEPTNDDEFYVIDLVGLAAVERDGTPVGNLVAVHNFGAGDILEIAPTDGGDTVMLPFAHDFVPEVVPGEHVVVVLPAEDTDE